MKCEIFILQPGDRLEKYACNTIEELAENMQIDSSIDKDHLIFFRKDKITQYFKQKIKDELLYIRYKSGDNIIFFGIVIETNVSEDEIKVALIKRFSKYKFVEYIFGKYVNNASKPKFITGTGGFPQRTSTNGITRLTNLLISRLNII